jgi:thymidylate synthase-like protein
MGVKARVLTDSYYGPEDQDGWPLPDPHWTRRVTTLEVVIPRIVLAEFNTHRAFSRNSASSRAIPFAKMLQRVQEDPFIPLSFPAEQRGMQGGEELGADERRIAELAWLQARDAAVRHARGMADLGVHKSVVNRLLEPFMWHTVIVTSAEWDNFFRQRCSPLAQPEIRVAAEAMRDAIAASKPHWLTAGAWHRPLLDGDEDTIFEVQDSGHPDQDGVFNRISAARCARVSYLTHEGKRDWMEDLNLFTKLATADPPHWSPLEHVCRRPYASEAGTVKPGNLPGFVQLRHIVSGEFKEYPDQ